MELEITWSRVVRVWWSYAWRSLIATVVAMLISMVLGFVIGFFMGAMGVPVRVIQSVAVSLGFVIGLAISVVPMKMILGKDFREFRLVLLARQAPAEPSSSTPEVIQ